MKTRVPHLAALTVALAVACSHKTAVPDPEVEQSTEAEAAPKTSDAAQLFTVDDGKVVLRDLNGNELNSFAVPFEADATFVDSVSGVVYVLADRTVFTIDLQSGESQAIADLGANKHQCDTSEWGLSLQDRNDFGLTTDGGLCVTLMDRNVNAMSVAIEYRVAADAERSASAAVRWDADKQCGEPVKEPCAIDAARTVIGGAPRSGDTSVTVEDGTCNVRLPNGTVALKGQGCALELVSPSGRFVGVTLTDESGGDYIHRTLFVVDTERGAELADFRMEIVGETTLAWAPGADTLLVGESLLMLGDEPKKLEVGPGALFIAP